LPAAVHHECFVPHYAIRSQRGTVIVIECPSKAVGKLSAGARNLCTCGNSAIPAAIARRRAYVPSLLRYLTGVNSPRAEACGSSLGLRSHQASSAAHLTKLPSSCVPRRAPLQRARPLG
jgi:hypothetical protein